MVLSFCLSVFVYLLIDLAAVQKFYAALLQIINTIGGGNNAKNACHVASQEWRFIVTEAIKKYKIEKAVEDNTERGQGEEDMI
jgi:hypothetical protein